MSLQPWTKVNVFRLWLPALRHRRMLRINFLCVNTWFWALYRLQLLCSDRSCYVLNNADILDQWLSILRWGIASILCCHMGNEARHVVSNLPRGSQSGWDQASREENQYNRCRCCVAMLETHSMCGTAMAKDKCISIFLSIVYCLLQLSFDQYVPLNPLHDSTELHQQQVLGAEPVWCLCNRKI